MRLSRVIAIAGFLGVGTFAHAESAVPLNYVDDFGSRSPAFTSDGNPVATVELARDCVASVNGPGAAAIESSTAGITARSQAPALDREWIASVNGPNGAELAPTHDTIEELARK